MLIAPLLETLIFCGDAAACSAVSYKLRLVPVVFVLGPVTLVSRLLADDNV